MSIKGPYVDGAWLNTPGETIFLCISCANDRGVPEKNALMYDDMKMTDKLECKDCGEMFRDYS